MNTNVQKSTISIITPVYKGKKYLNNLLNIIETAVKEIPEYPVEWVVVNDYPTEKIVLPTTCLQNLSIKLISNPYNLGIQKSRIKGIKECKGQYILLLDQDDEISKTALKLHIKNLNNSDVSITNGYVENKNNEIKKIFSTASQIKCTKDIKYYFYIGDIIVSPGMVMIKKSAIPKVWLENILSINGADDWLLWVLMLATDKKFCVSFLPTYIHKNTGNNTSGNKVKMWESTEEALEIFKNNTYGYEKLCKIFKRRITMIKAFQIQHKNKFIVYLNNLDIATYVIKYKVFKKYL